ncbi:Arsenical pump membrane protein [Psilocybe cubensis]|uniref:Citrate transporter-like domain-containing protein n=2 Tax=Psilocybe cubensis TaxID=181762 RepID=A0A8H7XRV6_PSICU|nr:Arsenical pump membrane protein [Psilocybe cubensis]KAH9474785.1 Arsenical pump membrane protein [Psilocybe cubensis]
MSNIDRFSIVTLILFFLSTLFVIHPVSFHVRLPVIGKIRLTIGLMSAPIIAIAILWAAQCLGPTQIRNGIVGTDDIKPYNILILFISLAYMAITLDVTGILQAAAFWVSNKGGDNGRKLYFYFYILLTGISMVVGNDPIILSGTAFLVYYTAATGLEPIAWLISEFAAANTASMVLFVGNPTNVVICEGFRINNAAFTAYTILPFLACSVACYAALAFQYRDSKHVPRRLSFTAKLDVRQVLKDPVSACFGSALLITCLIVVIVLSFLHVDVWKVTLPFAGAKFIFDLSWDHYRYTTGRIPRYGEKGESEDASGDDPMVSELKRAMSMPHDLERPATFTSMTATATEVAAVAQKIEPAPTKERAPTAGSSDTAVPKEDDGPRLFDKQRTKLDIVHAKLAAHFPTFFTALPRLPFGLIPFAFSQFILIEGLSHQGWIEVFGIWLVRASGRQMIPTVWLIGVLGVILCNVAGTNIGATILLTKVVHAAPDFPVSSQKAAAIALAVSSNIGAVSFTFSASLAGLLWKTILGQKGITIKQTTFAFWNMLPLLAMTGVGLAIVTAEMVVLY